MKLYFSHAVACLILIAGLSLSCTKDEDYSFDKIDNADSVVTIWEDGVKLPVDTTITINITDVIGESSHLKTDDSGNYYIYAAGQPKEKSIDIPAISINPPRFGIFSVQSSTGEYAGKTLTKSVNEALDDPISRTLTFSLSTSIPDEVADIKSVDLSASVTLTLSETSGMLKLPVGFTISFPEGLQFTKADYQTWYSVTTADGRSTLSFTRARTMGTGSSLVCNLKLTHIDVKPEWLDLQNRKIVFTESITVSGQPWIRAVAGTTVPEFLTLALTGIIGTINVSNVSAKAKATAAIGEKSMDISLPAALTDANLKLDDSNITFSVDNTDTPFDYQITGTIKGTKKGTEVASPVGISMNVAAGELLDEVLKGEGITNIISAMPDKIYITDVVVNAYTPDWISMASSQSYTIKMSYSVNAPLVLLQGSEISIVKEVSNELTLGEKAGLDAAKIKFKALNGIPLDMDMTMKMYVNDVLVDVVPDNGRTYFEFSAAGGQATVKDEVAVIKSDEVIRKLGNMQVSAISVVKEQKVTLNKHQDFRINLYSIVASDGVTLDLSNDKKTEED